MQDVQTKDAHPAAGAAVCGATIGETARPRPRQGAKAGGDRADNSAMQAIGYGKLLLIAKLGGLLPRGKKGAGRGHKNGKAALPFSKVTAASYRKVAGHADVLPEYREELQGRAGKENPSAGRNSFRPYGSRFLPQGDREAEGGCAQSRKGTKR